MRAGRALFAVLFLATPLLVYWGLENMQPRYVTLIVLALLLLRLLNSRWLARLRRHAGPLVGVGLLVAALLWVDNDPLWVLCYPVVVNAVMGVVFAWTLWRPPSLIERLARLQMPDLPPEGVRHTRRVTMAWCVFFALNGGMALATAFMSREVWVLYNGLISYLLMGGMFAGEWFLRKRLLRGGARAA